jgi:hypothetical protein
MKTFFKLIFLGNKQIVFIYCFSLLQNATNVDNFSLLLMNIYYLLNRPYFDQLTKNALNSISFKLKNRNIAEHLDFGSLDKTETMMEPEEYMFINFESIDTLKKHSKFNKV